MNLKVFQVFHKDYPRSIDSSWIVPIGVSGYRPDDFISDADGDNISSLNKYYCELTVLYYIWKNAKSDYVGLYHYRRYLNFKVDNSILDPLVPGRKIYEPDLGVVGYLSDNQQLELAQEFLGICDVVVPRNSILGPTVKTQYLGVAEGQPWRVFEQVLERKYFNSPNVLRYFDLTHLAPICNMFLMKWSVFDAYCKDLFEIIDEVYATVGTPFDAHNNRYPGFLAERFLGFWLHINRVSFMEVPMVAFR